MTTTLWAIAYDPDRDNYELSQNYAELFGELDEVRLYPSATVARESFLEKFPDAGPKPEERGYIPVEVHLQWTIPEL